MTISVVNRNPEAAATSVSPSVHPRFSLFTDGQVDPATVSVWAGNELMIDGGQSLGASSAEESGFGGMDIVIVPRQPLADEDIVVRVVADEIGGGAAIDETWTFTVVDVVGPVIADASPPPWSITTNPATGLTLRLVDQGADYDVVPNVVELTATATFDGDQVSAPGADFTGREGLLMQVTSGPDTGERRRITSVQGPELATYDGAVLADGDIEVFGPRGLDIYVAGTRVVHSGFLDSDAQTAGWAAAIIAAGGEVDVTLTPPASWADGERVDVFVKVTDDNPLIHNTSKINYFFDVLDTRGPQVFAITPEEGARGLDAAPTPNSDIVFDVLCSEDVGDLDVWVNGVAAITNLLPVGIFSTSTVTPITDGYRVTLKNSSGYTDGDIAFVDIASADNSVAAREGERRVLRYHFGTTVDEQAVVHGLTGDVVRILAYDLSETSFADPTSLGHTGYAWDGYWYDDGARGDAQASWFLELGAFPVSGHVVVTTDGWAIVKSLGAGAWMSCTTTAGWSMAGTGTVNDADFGPAAKLAVVSDVVVVVDFDLDRAQKFDTLARTIGATDVEHRDDNQTTASTDVTLTLPAGPYTHVAAVADTDDLVLAIGVGGSLTVVTDLSSELLTTLVARDGAVPPALATSAFAGSWVRLRLDNLDAPASMTPMAVAYNDGGQGQVEVWDWFKFLAGDTVTLFLDDASTPALAAAEIRDLDMVHAPLYVAAAMVGEVDILDFDDLSIVAYGEVALGLSGVAGAELSAVALEPNFEPDLGTLYASVSAAADGRVVAFDVHTAANQVMSSGTPAPFLSAIGSTRHNTDSYVRASMEIA
jgi:hypothetical protein